MSDRAEREKQLDWLYRLKSNLKIFIPKDFHLAEFEQSLDYAISSIKTDLKYNLLYEETTHTDDADKKIEPTTKTCRSCRNFGLHHGICEICKDNKCWTEKEPTKNDDVVALNFSDDIDTPNKYQTADVKWHEGRIPTTKNDLAQERYQDLIEYFGDEKVAKTILESRKEFKAWLERVKWNLKRADELARELEQMKSTTKNDLAVDCIVDVLGSYTDLDIPYKREIAENILTKLPSVTPQLSSELDKNSKKLEKDFGELDCISRAEVIDIVENTATEWLKGDINFMYPSLIKKIKGVPSVTPQEQRWIPVNEKLPDIHNYSDNYLVTLKRGGVYIATFTECDGKHWWTYDDVIAWMPLPPSYKGE